MASATLPAGAQPVHRDLIHWMDRVPKELNHLRKSADKEAVHDLRVAIRRCRSLGAVMAEIDPDRAWREMRRLPKKLFRTLGELRDAQIMDVWVKEHGAENDTLRLQLQESFESKEPQLLEDALRMAHKFDEKAWHRLQRKLAKRMRLVPLGSLAAQCLTMERFQEARKLHNKALRSKKPQSWHELRIGFKKLRYTAESLLPEQSKPWSNTLKRVQDMLGEVHDLDVLRALLGETASGDAAERKVEWERMIEAERSARLAEYRELTQGEQSFWQDWQHSLPHGRRVQSAALGRLRATARATDTHPRRTAQISRLSVALFDALHRAHAALLFRDREMRRVLRAAVRLCGARVKGGGASQKTARHFLLSLPTPPSWTHAEWELMAWTIRYHRGPEPKSPQIKETAFARLHQEQQKRIRALAGVIRLARGLRKCGVEIHAGWRARGEKSADAVRLYIPGLLDSVENVSRLAAAKHLLDSYLEKPLILKPAPELQPEEAKKVLTLVARNESQPRFSAASD